MTAHDRTTVPTGRIRFALHVGALLGALGISGCGFDGYESDFPVAIGNRTSSTITVFVNAKELGNVGVGQTASFNVRLQETDAYSATSASPVALATFSARELTTGMLSAEKNVAVTQNPAAYVTFTDADFGISTPSTTPVSADFNFSPLDPTISRGTNTVFFDATASSAGVTNWMWDFGDGSSGTGQKASHPFTLQGQWVVRLTVNDSFGHTATTTRTVAVR